MKKLWIAISALLMFSSADAAYFTLVSCNFQFIPELGKSVYIGTYRSSMTGTTWVGHFDTYCPASINR